MQRTSFLPSVLNVSPRPCEQEIRIKAPALKHHERPKGGQHG